MNQQNDLHGILIQSPLPKHMNEEALTELIDPRKDVDGFHPVNLGRLVQGRSDGMVPCTPAGVMEMLRWAEVDLTGKKAVVLGRSFNVGMPQALLLAARGVDATVTVVHSRTKDAKSECLQADVIVAAVGRPEMIQPDWVKKGQSSSMLESIVLRIRVEKGAGGLLETSIPMSHCTHHCSHRFQVVSDR